jgi:uncharacterized membrane protein
MANWEGGAVPVYTDLGPCGILSNENGDAWTDVAVTEWNEVPTSAMTARVEGDFASIGLPDIDGTNGGLVIGTFNGGGIHVIFDSDGGVLENTLGISSFAALGVSSVEVVAADTNEILEAWTIINGTRIWPSDTIGARFSGVFTHELGHTLNLAHTQTNGAAEAYNNQTGPAGCETPWPSGAPPRSSVETMYPFIDVSDTGDTGSYMRTVDRLDDIVALSDIYPAPGWPSSHGTIRGTVYLSDFVVRAENSRDQTIENDEPGRNLAGPDQSMEFGEGRDRRGGGDRLGINTQITGVNVIARNIENPLFDANSTLTGAYSQGQLGPDGSFTLNGLTPGAEYLVYVDGAVQGVFSVPRPGVLPGPEEFYNGVMESGDGITDRRCDYTTIMPAQGVSIDANMAFNRVDGAPEFIPLDGAGIPMDISTDGSIVVGSLGDGYYRWTRDGGIEDIGGMSAAGEISITPDGSMIVASAATDDGTAVPAIWLGGSDWQVLDWVPGGGPCGETRATAYGLSGDGSTIVGGGYTGPGCADFRAFKWTATNGYEILDGEPGEKTRANGVNHDGSVIVGWAEGFGRQGARWVDGVFYPMSPDPATTFIGEAYGVTADGSMITGLDATDPATDYPGGWIWTEADGFTVYPMPPFDRGGGLGEVNAEGSVGVGYAQQGFFARIPTIWTAELGIVSHAEFINAQGTWGQDWFSLGLVTVSDDGSTVGGFADTIYGRIGYIVQGSETVICHNDPLVGPVNLKVPFPDGLDCALANGDMVGICPQTIHGNADLYPFEGYCGGSPVGTP